MKEQVLKYIQDNSRQLPFFYQGLHIKDMDESGPQNTVKLVTMPLLQTDNYRVYPFYKPVSQMSFFKSDSPER